MANVIEILVTGRNLTKPAFDEAARNGRAIGQHVGDEFTTGIEDKVKQDLPPAVEDPLEESGKKGGEKGGKAAGDSFLANASPLMLGAFAAAASAGPGLILAGTAAAVIGAGALITKGNADLQNSYQNLGRDASDAIEQATAPLVPALKGAVTVLDQGLAHTGGELKDVFAAAAPMAQDMARGVLALVDNALPGLASGMRAIAPYSHEIADDFGKLGSGVSGFFSGLAGGAGGGMVGFSALIDVVSHLLTDVGQVTGALANGLGPALHDISDVAIPVAGALTAFIDALPPDMIRAAADATAALFLVFKAASLAGVLKEGTSFLAFLGAAATGEVALAGETVTLSTAMTRLGATAAAALGPLGILAGVTTGLYFAVKNDNGAVQGMLDKVEAEVNARRQQVDVLTQASHAAQTHADVIDVLTQRLTAANLSTQDSARQSAAATLAALGFSDGESTLATSLNATLQAFDEDSNAASALKQAYDALFGKYASYSEAQAQFTIDLENVAKQVTAGKDATNLSTDAGAKNLELFKQLADQNETRAEALLRETGSQDKANQSLYQGALALDQAAKKAGFTKDQIDQLNLSLYGTKNLSDLKITVGADTTPAENTVRGLLNNIDNSQAFVQVNAVGGNAGGKAYLPNAHGGIIGGIGAAATGGVHGSLTKINEQGEEMVRLPSGSMVMSHPDTMRELGRQQSAPARLEIEWVGGNAGDEFLTWLRRNIRIRGGDVQNVLGH